MTGDDEVDFSLGEFRFAVLKYSQYGVEKSCVKCPELRLNAVCGRGEERATAHNHLASLKRATEGKRNDLLTMAAGLTRNIEAIDEAMSWKVLRLL